VGAALQLEGIRKTLGRREILKGISFAVEAGDVFGYLGSNGAGKTTTIRILLDLIRATSGDVRVMGKSAASTDVRRRMGFLLDADGLYNAMSAAENLEFYARIYRLKNASARIAALLQGVGLAERARDRVGTFSKGMRQRLGLARALVHEPEILILDEPMSGIDPSGRVELRQILLDVVRRGGKTIFLSSHDLDEVQRICNRIALIDEGRIRLQGELASLMRGMGDQEVVIDVGTPCTAALDGGPGRAAGGAATRLPGGAGHAPHVCPAARSRGFGHRRPSGRAGCQGRRRGQKGGIPGGAVHRHRSGTGGRGVSDLSTLVIAHLRNSYRLRGAVCVMLGLSLLLVATLVALVLVLAILPETGSPTPDAARAARYVGLIAYGSGFLVMGMNLNVFTANNLVREKTQRVFEQAPCSSRSGRSPELRGCRAAHL
jgi:ABC-2 type transport system ATP-binding protein